MSVWVMDPPPDHLSARSAADRRPQPRHYCVSADENLQTTSNWIMCRTFNTFTNMIYIVIETGNCWNLFMYCRYVLGT